jgi:3-methyladenine DNA glycosylase AlkD
MNEQTVLQAIFPLADEDYAQHLLRFYKTAEGEYGYGDKFLGIRVPALRKLVKQFRHLDLPEDCMLLSNEYHEVRMFALLLLVDKFERGDEQIKNIIFKQYLRNWYFINNWDLVDCSAHKIVGAFLIDKDKSKLIELAVSKHLWQRRIAIVSTWYFIRRGHFETTLALCEMLLTDSEDLMHKACGWMLREVGKQDIAVLEAFLTSHYQKMPRTMLRYAIEKFPEAQRKAYLNGAI